MKTKTAKLIMVLLLLPASTFSLEWNINPDGSGDAPTIQAGIDSASAGDEVVLADGIFVGEGNRDIEFRGKAITVRSASGDPEACIVDLLLEHGWEPRRGFYFHEGEGRNSVLSGITIRDGYQPPWDAESYGGGILCDGSSPTIEECHIRDCQADYGGGVCFRNGAVALVIRCVVSNNSGKEGGGISSRDTEGVEILSCRVSGNSANRGGGIDHSPNSSATIEGCEIYSNIAYVVGGGVSAYGGHFRLIDCVISDNKGQSGGGGIFCYNSEENRVNNCIITGNSATQTGGVAITAYSDMVITGSTISSNYSQFNSPGGVLCDGATIALKETIIYGNCRGDLPGDVNEIWAGSDGDGGYISIECCVTDSSKVGGTGTVEWIGVNVFEDPLFCDPAVCDDTPSVDGDFTLHADSPCLDHPVCGRIGALGEGCGGSTPVEETSWGEIKSMFR